MISGFANAQSSLDCTNESLVRFATLTINNTGDDVSQITVKANINILYQNITKSSLRITDANDLTNYYPHYTDRWNESNNATVYFYVDENWNANEVKEFAVCGSNNTNIADASNKTGAFWYYRDFEDSVFDLSGCTISIETGANCQDNSKCLKARTPNLGLGNACKNGNWFDSYPAYSKGSFNMSMPMVYESQLYLGTVLGNHGSWFMMFLNSSSLFTMHYGFESITTAPLGIILGNTTNEAIEEFTNSPLASNVWMNVSYKSFGNGTFVGYTGDSFEGYATMSLTESEVTGFGLMSAVISSSIDSYWDDIRGYKTFSVDDIQIVQTQYISGDTNIEFNNSLYSPKPTFSTDIVNFIINISDDIYGLSGFIFSWYNYSINQWQNSSFFTLESNPTSVVTLNAHGESLSSSVGAFPTSAGFSINITGDDYDALIVKQYSDETATMCYLFDSSDRTQLKNSTFNASQQCLIEYPTIKGKQYSVEIDNNGGAWLLRYRTPAFYPYVLSTISILNSTTNIPSYSSDTDYVVAIESISTVKNIGGAIYYYNANYSSSIFDTDYFNWTWFANNTIGQTEQSQYFYLNVTDVSPPVIIAYSINDSEIYHNDEIFISVNASNNRMLDKCWLYDSWNGVNHSFTQLDNVSDTCNIVYDVTAPHFISIDYTFYINDSHGLVSNFSFNRFVLNSLPMGIPQLNVSSATFTNDFNVKVSNVTDATDNDTLSYLFYFEFNNVPPTVLAQNSTNETFYVDFVADGNHYLKVIAYDGYNFSSESSIYTYILLTPSGGGSNASFSFFINQSAKLNYNECPSTSASLILLIFLFIVGIGLFVIGKKYRANILGVIGGIIIIVFGVIIFNCQELMGIIMIAIGIIIALISALTGKII